MSKTRHQPLVIEWSPSRVRVYDPAAKAALLGRSIPDCIPEGHGREAIVAVSQRSAFIRSVHVPALSKEETAKTLSFKLSGVLPVNGQDVVYGFRLGRNPNGDGNTAIVGAIKTDSLRRILQEATESGLRVRAVLPLAFGSWMAARAFSLSDCAVVHSNEESLTIDVVEGRELRYSRTVPKPPSQEEIDEEIDASFCIAKTAPSPILSSASPDVRADHVDPRHAVEYLADPHAIERLLFTLELPEKTKAKQDRVARSAAQRAILVAVAALAMSAYVYRERQTEASVAGMASENHEQLLRKARAEEKDAETSSDRAGQTKAIIDLTFTPAQTFTDIVSVLGSDAPTGVWLTGLTFTRGQSFLVRGTATDGRLVAKYVANLSRRSRFRDVRLAFANRATIGKKPVTQFGISGHALGNFAIDQLPKKEEKKP